MKEGDYPKSLICLPSGDVEMEGGVAWLLGDRKTKCRTRRRGILCLWRRSDVSFRQSLFSLNDAVPYPFRCRAIDL